MGAGVELRILSMNYMSFCFVIYIRDSVPNCFDRAYSTRLFFFTRDLASLALFWNKNLCHFAKIS